MIHVKCCHGNGSIFMKIMTSQVIQVTWLVGQVINPDSLHVSRNLSILIVASVELEQKTKLTNYWPVVDYLMTSLLRHTIVILLFKLSQSFSVPFSLNISDYVGLPSIL